MDRVFFTSTSRAFVGAPLCRNEEYLLYSIGFAAWLGSAAILVGLYAPLIETILRISRGFAELLSPAKGVEVSATCCSRWHG